MERRLILMRHAESAWKTLGGSDHDRPLTPQGSSDAPKVATHLVALGWRPEAVLSSDALRTRETWAQMSQAIPKAPEPLFAPALYLAGLEDIWSEAHSVNPSVETLLVLGHNPGWERAVFTLSGLDKVMTPATAMLLIGSGDDWPSALRGKWSLSEVIRPPDTED